MQEPKTEPDNRSRQYLVEQVAYLEDQNKELKKTVRTLVNNWSLAVIFSFLVGVAFVVIMILLGFLP